MTARSIGTVRSITLASLMLLISTLLAAQEAILKGRVVDSQARALPGVSLQLLSRHRVLARSRSGAAGEFSFPAALPGEFTITAEAPEFRPVMQSVTVRAQSNANITITMSQLASRIESITVTADVNESGVMSPDPGEKVFIRQDLLDANPGRPGAPVSIPGYPIETASSGIKAPQYFAPGVAGNHGEPIAQYIAVGNSLVPNNLSANAHGNGYADPNIFVPEVLESVQVDGGAFNVREGNHSVNLAATYGFRSQLDPFLALTGDYRDIDIVTGFSPSPASWLAFSGSYGNGFLTRLEHRQQYKINGERLFNFVQHRLSLLGVGYYGKSKIPGLVPIFLTDSDKANLPELDDSIDPRQKDQTHTALLAANDLWQPTPRQELQLSGFFRTYNLALYSNFGEGLIRQSEFRTEAGGSANYQNKVGEYLSLLAGLDYRREAPRRDNLDHYGMVDANNLNSYGPFTPVTSNNLTISPLAPYLAAEGAVGKHFRYYLGWRRDEIDFDNQDRLRPNNSFQKWVGVNSPKATVSFLPGDSSFLPLVSLSFGQAFYTNDPRIGAGNTAPTPVNTAHSFQLVASKSVYKTDIRLLLGHVTTSQTLGQLDADTGLQQDQGVPVVSAS